MKGMEPNSLVKIISIIVTITVVIVVITAIVTYVSKTQNNNGDKQKGAHGPWGSFQRKLMTMNCLEQNYNG
jgi:flagellar basal body-associated protein FliL